jgi:pimeloyl-ACP methyl ester carboxylesterase
MGIFIRSDSVRSSRANRARKATQFVRPLAHTRTAFMLVTTVSLLAAWTRGASTMSDKTANDAPKAQAQGPWGGDTKGVGHYASVNGIDLYYERIGKQTGAKPLILLHGGFGAIEMFGPNLAALANGRQVIAVDLQGHGRTADIDRPITTAAMAGDVAALIRHLQLDRPDIMGFSMGGQVALQVAARHPELVNRLVMVSVPVRYGEFWPEIREQQKQLLNPGTAEGMTQTPMYQLYASIAPHPGDWPRLVSKMAAWINTDYDFTQDVPTISAPALVVAGDADIFSVAHAVEIFGMLGGAKRDGGWDGAGRPKSALAILPGLTHYTISNAPALANAVIPFLDAPTR